MKAKKAGSFVAVSSSGAVSVKLSDYLTTPAAKNQLRKVRSLRDFKVAHRSASTGQLKKAESDTR
ncbi:hypothetical protein [Steroidobacter agaridevorans]|uniref:hypothetical protein n=1 Tax=Steroidobacter agaridevorans TaxID=2695856 RepID=UPI00137B03CD|nr:hypothetical protein [Steroidobacter agaridevorans]